MQKNPFEQFNIGEGDNPLLRSMETLRNAWSAMPDNPLTSMTPLQLQSPEELEKRISELQTVENWLALNLTMLRNTIQALEIQRTTLTTFQSFAQMQWPGSAEHSASTEKEQPQKESTQTTAPEGQEALMKAGQAWWDLMQQQFQTLVHTAQSSIDAASADTTFGKTDETAHSETKKTAAKTAAKKAKPAKKTQAKKAAKKGSKAAKKRQDT